MHIRAFGVRVTIVLRDEFLSWKVLRDAKSMGTADLKYVSYMTIVPSEYLTTKRYLITGLVMHLI
jgi:hypothetical protein